MVLILLATFWTSPNHFSPFFSSCLCNHFHEHPYMCDPKHPCGQYNSTKFTFTFRKISEFYFLRPLSVAYHSTAVCELLFDVLASYWVDQNVNKLELLLLEFEQFAVYINSHSFSRENRMRDLICVNPHKCEHGNTVPYFVEDEHTPTKHYSAVFMSRCKGTVAERLLARYGETVNPFRQNLQLLPWFLQPVFLAAP